MIDTIFDTFNYEKETGVITKNGNPTGWVNKNGYTYVTLPTNLGGKKVLAHRLAWFLSYGYWPDGDVDHINRNRSDNRLCNLRLLQRSSNLLNMETPLLKGIYRDNERGKWRVRLGRSGAMKRFTTFCEAYKYRKGQYAKATV